MAGKSGSALSPHRPLRAAGWVLLTLLASCADNPLDPGEDPRLEGILSKGTELYTYRVVADYPHDPEAFTQGLVFDQGELFEGTGRRGRSSLRRVDLETGTVLQRLDLAPDLFGEGITIRGNRIIQLTWQSRRGFVYDRESFSLEREFSYETEGWGITHDGARLVMSDGTSRLYWLDPETLQVLSEMSVRWQGTPVERLNELEYIEGHIFANVWLTDRIAIIDPERGTVVSWLDLTGLLPAHESADAGVLNGIAFDADKGRVLVTGKLWPRIFEIALVPAR